MTGDSTPRITFLFEPTQFSKGSLENFRTPTISYNKKWVHIKNPIRFLAIPNRILLFKFYTLSILIFSFLIKKTYATKDTILSKALPMPNSKAIPVSVGVHTFVA